MRGATVLCPYHISVRLIFQSTLPMRGATLFDFESFLPHILFQSTLPMRGATVCNRFWYVALLFQSTLPMRGATTATASKRRNRRISIHTPHAGSDEKPHSSSSTRKLFQSTLPMRGATPPDTAILTQDIQFQSTLPMRGATRFGLYYILSFLNFNPHSPCGERLCKINISRRHTIISIHTPHAGSDVFKISHTSLVVNFNPHSPCGERP